MEEKIENEEIDNWNVKTEISEQKEKLKITDELISFLLDNWQKYLNKRWTIFYIVLIVFVLSFLTTFLSLWWSWIITFFFFLIWLFKEWLLLLYNFIPLNLWFNIWLNWNSVFDMFLFNFLIILEIVLKVFLFLIMYKFLRLYLKKNLITEESWWTEENVNLWYSIKQFLNWKNNHFTVFATLKEFFSKYFIPLSWTILWFLFLFLVINSNSVKVKYTYNPSITTNTQNNNEKTKKIITFNANNNLTILKKITENKNIKINWKNEITKMEKNVDYNSKFDNILLYYITKDKRYIKKYETKKTLKEYEKIENIKEYPEQIKKFLDLYKLSLEKNTNYVLYNKMFLANYMTTIAYFNWKTINNDIYKVAEKITITSLLFLFFMLLWLDISIILLFKFLFVKE